MFTLLKKDDDGRSPYRYLSIKENLFTKRDNKVAIEN